MSIKRSQSQIDPGGTARVDPLMSCIYFRAVSVAIMISGSVRCASKWGDGVSPKMYLFNLRNSGQAVWSVDLATSWFSLRENFDQYPRVTGVETQLNHLYLSHPRYTSNSPLYPCDIDKEHWNTLMNLSENFGIRDIILDNQLWLTVWGDNLAPYFYVSRAIL